MKPDAALFRMLDDARCSDLLRGEKWIFDRLSSRPQDRLSRTYTRGQVRSIIKAYNNRPHVCAIAVDHTFGGRCGKGNYHRGCCPGEC